LYVQQTPKFFCADLHMLQNFLDICFAVIFFSAMSFARMPTISSIFFIAQTWFNTSALPQALLDGIEPCSIADTS